VHVEAGRRSRVTTRSRPRRPTTSSTRPPLLVSDGKVANEPEASLEGFKAAAHQFDLNPSEGRHLRDALGWGDRIYAFMSDGRSRQGAGPHPGAARLADGGIACREAINLHCSGSATPSPGGVARQFQVPPKRWPAPLLPETEYWRVPSELWLWLVRAIR
jgi:hypothetical protein